MLFLRILRIRKKADYVGLRIATRQERRQRHKLFCTLKRNAIHILYSFFNKIEEIYMIL